MHPRKKLAVIVAVAGLLGAGNALAQPTLNNPSGGTGNADMDHSRMGGGAQGQRSTGPAPTLNTPGGGTGNADMDHSRMGGGQGAGSPAGGRITGNSGEGGPEVRHGHAPIPEPRQETRPGPRR